MANCKPTEEGKASSCDTGCTGIVLERNRYYTGKYMAARDFQDEQDYSVGRHRLHNRLLHGWGIVCGLEVDYHDSPDCKARWVIVRAGMAIDCCGRELFLCRNIGFELPLPRAARPEPAPTQNPDEKLAPEHVERGDVMHGPFLLGIAYRECPIDYVPALYGDNTCSTERQQPNRVREDIELVCVPLDKVGETCWQVPGEGGKTPCNDDCSGSSQGGNCMEPKCPCGSMVPLALVTFDANHPGKGFRLDDRGRKHLAAAGDLLTHIVHINWPHGGELSLKELDDMKRTLRVRFDRKLLRAQGWRNGINPMTFVVQYSGVQRTIEFLPQEENTRLEANDCEAAFTIDEAYVKDTKRRENIAGTWVYVTLKCDFIMDCHHMPVDGNFLRGRLPTGDGVPGGTFESWFHVVDEKHEGKREEAV